MKAWRGAQPWAGPKPAPALVALNAAVAWVGPLKAQRLLEALGSPEAVVSAPAHRLSAAAQLPLTQGRALRLFFDQFDAAAEGQALDAVGARCVALGAPGYPRRLAEAAPAPLLLNVIGRLPADDEAVVAIVGTRQPSDYGMRMARQLAAGLARAGVWVASGLAYGIDSVAHQACLEAGGRTVAVLGNRLDRPYPQEHRPLAEAIVAGGGAVISQFSCTVPGQQKQFPMRNAVISGLSLGVVVVEGARVSGALITAERALEQGREVFAVPGLADDERAQGPLDLLEQGARLVRGADDILVELGLIPARPRARATARPAEAVAAQPPLPMDPGLAEGSDARALWQALKGKPGLDRDAAGELSGLAAPALAVAVTELELLGLLKQASGARLALVDGA
jgi:DNA processing protein